MTLLSAAVFSGLPRSVGAFLSLVLLFLAGRTPGTAGAAEECSMGAFTDVGNCQCMPSDPQGDRQVYDCLGCIDLRNSLVASCKSEFEAAKNGLAAAKTPAEIREHEKTLKRVLEVAGQGNFDFSMYSQTVELYGPVDGRSPPFLGEIAGQEKKVLETVAEEMSRVERIDSQKPPVTQPGVQPDDKEKKIVSPVVAPVGEVVLPDGSPQGVPVIEIENRLRAGEYEDVERDLDRILRNDPGNVKALALRSSVRLKQGDLEGALSDAEEILALDPGNKEAREIKDYIELTGRVQDTSVKLKAPDFGSKDMGARFDGGGEAGLAGAGGSANRSGRGPSQAGGGGAAEAVDAGGTGWTATGRDGPDQGSYAPAAHGTLPMSQGLSASQVLARSADKKLRLGDLSGAFLEATRAVRADRGNPAAWALRASVANKLKKYDAAIADATEALRIEPKNVPALLERGFAQYNLGNYETALEDIGRALRIEPMNALAYLYRGMVFEKLARYTEALSDYETAAKLDPTLRQFWEDAKARLLGKKPGAGGAKTRSARRAAVWAACAGLVVLVFLGRLWTRRKPDEGSHPETTELP